MKTIAISLLLGLCPVMMYAAQQEQSDYPHQSVGLVLSGGGAKGIAHIGVIQALEDNNVPIDYIAGTSMGSIVGGLYASGYTPDEMMQLITSRDFAYWSTGRIDENLVYYFAKSTPTPAMATIPIALGRDTASVVSAPTSLISPLPMNFAFMNLFSAYTAQCGGNFDHLFVPFRCVASDVKDKHKVVLSHGQLGDAIRASMSFPVVFQPIEIDGTLLYDGGIYDNFPVDVMRSEFAPAIMIGVDVHGTTDPAKARDLINQVEEMVIQNNDYTLPPDEGIKIRIDLNEFSLLDFQAAKAIYDIGYSHAMAMMDSIKTRVKSRIPAETRRLRRDVFKSATPYVRFDHVNVSGGTPAQNHYIDYLFTKNSPETFDIERARLSYYRAITPGTLRNLLPTAVYNDSTGMFKLDLKADVRNNLSVGVGGYLTSSANSMAFVSARYNSVTLNTMDASLDAWIGQSYMAASLATRLVLPSAVPSALSMQAVVWRRKYYESDRLFFDASVPTFITAVEAMGRLSYTVAAGRNSKASIQLGGGTHISRFYRNGIQTYLDASRDNTRFNTGQARLTFESSTLDNLTAPTTGHSCDIAVSYNLGRYHYRPGVTGFEPTSRNARWLQAQARITRFGRINKHLSLGGEFNAVYTNRRLLDNYNASIVNAPAFTPTPASDNTFNPAFRANAFMTIGFIPVWSINDNLQVRGNFHLFQPFRRILLEPVTDTPYYGRWFSKRFAYCEVSAAYTFPFATLSAWADFQSYPARNWNVGMSFGLYFLAPTLN